MQPIAAISPTTRQTRRRQHFPLRELPWIVEFSLQQPIDDAKATWKRLADYGNIADWNSGILASRVISETQSGVGTERQCDLKGAKYVREKVTQWDPKAKRLALEFTHFPAPVAITATFTVHEDHVNIDYWFQGKGAFRPIAPLLKPVFKKAVRGLLEDLARSEA